MGGEEEKRVWGECVWLGRCLLPLMDVEAWRRDSRAETFQKMGVERGEYVFGVFAGIVFHSAVKDAVAEGSSLSVATLDAVPLKAVLEVVTDRADYAFLIGMPSAFMDEAEETAALALRLCVYVRYPHVPVLRRYLAHTLLTLTGRVSTPGPTCADLRGWAHAAGVRRA
ncbi:hypothetical protein IAG44_21730 [Streptomyces roseirectus]|uniref:Uncharacterized protein n=1 Tax=Streptomyces roseirectus TaxID=2768066 RepID=A0A7H0IG66_9ACTN|nr:hypothetical protein [Streptomyces roseirectus]QNP71782.1 hypothetical protein IAG44_21730 [Streptomyces roseirectus]